jgi:nitrogen-specific signal transduction histidine kinase
VSTWFLPTISEVVALTEPASGSQIENHTGDTAAQAEREWSAAIAALTQLLQQVTQQSSVSRAGLGSSVNSMQPQGLVLAGPSAMLDDARLNACLQSWIFTPEPFNPLSFRLLPATGHRAAKPQHPVRSIPLVPRDPLNAERFCLVLTADFSLVMALGKDPEGKPSFSFSFAPETAQKAWEVLRSRVLLTRSLRVDHLDTLVSQFAQIEPHYQIVVQFSRFLSKFLSALPQVHQSELPTGVNFSRVSHSQLGCLSSQPDIATESSLPSPQPSHIQTYDTHDEEQDPHSCRQASLNGSANHDGSPDIKLLRAIAHEVRTPLTTINTLTRLLLKRSDLPSEVVQRLESIHRECTEQIDRFGLIFRAAELKSEFQRSPIHLTSVSLTQVLQESTPRWQKQAARRNLTLHVALPQQMPAVVSDPMMLDQVLTGLIDRFTRSLTAGSHIYIQVALAGEQLKLQLRAQPSAVDASEPEVNSAVPVLESIGQLLMLQPETGSLSLSLPVTKNLFQALGGKLTVRKQPQQGEILTIFLPLGPESGATSQ